MESEESFVTFMDIDKSRVFNTMMSFHLPKNSPVVEVAQMSCFNVSMIQEIMMTDLVSPYFLKNWVFKLGRDPLVDVLVNLLEMVLCVVVNHNDFVSHL